MHFKLFQKCQACRKVKFFVRQRRFFQPKINQYITSKEPICGTCVKTYKAI